MTEETGGKKKTGKKKRMKIVATTSLPAVDCPNADRWNAARSRQNEYERNKENRCKAKAKEETQIVLGKFFTRPELEQSIVKGQKTS